MTTRDEQHNPVLQRPNIVFFDIDETLIVNDKNPMQHLAAMYNSHVCAIASSESGVTVNNEESRSVFKTTMLNYAKNLWFDIFLPDKSGRIVLEEMFKQALAAIKLDASHAPELVNEFIGLASTNVRAAPGSIEALQKLKDNGISTGIISNGFTELQQTKLDYLEITPLIDTLVVSEDAGAHKPNKKVFDYALRESGHKASTAWHIGDHVDYDVRGSIDCGLTGVFYDPSGDRLDKEFLTDKPDQTVKSFMELTDIIENT